MYGEILNALYLLNDVENEDAKVKYLQSLQEPAKALWLKYQNQFVYVDYTDHSTQAAYLLRYFPQYSQIIKFVLRDLKNNGTNLTLTDNVLDCALFGSGPCPEAFGLSEFINENLSNCLAINSISFDVNATAWSYARNITANSVIPRMFSKRPFKITPFDFDLSKPIEIENFEEKLKNKSLIVFQNCLNEINPSKYEQVLINLQSIYSLLPENALVIFIDLSGFKNVLKLLLHFQNSFEKEKVVVTIDETPNNYFAASLVNTMPQIMRENLLTGNKENKNGLIPRVYVDYHTLVLKK